MSATITSAAPKSVLLGVNDKSTRIPILEPEALPTHLAKMYTFAKKGPLTPQLAVGAILTNLYHADSFDLRKPFATHSTVFINTINAQGNAMMVQRVVPDDAAPPATIRLMADVLVTKLPVYVRNADGSIKTENGVKVKDGDKTINGYQVKWIVTQVPTDVDGNVLFGQATQEAGDQVDTTTGTQSVRYPFMDLQVSHVGEYGNHIGLRLSAPNANSSQPVDGRLLENSACYPYRLACVSRKNSKSTPTVTSTMYGEQFLNLVLKPNTIDPNTDALVYVGDVFLDAYRDITAPTWGPFGALHLYEDSIADLHEMFYLAEKPYIDGFSDFDGSGVEEAYRFNLISGQSSNGTPYHSFALVTGGANSVRFTENTTIYATGGSDGTMNETTFAELVTREVLEYANPNSVLQNTAKYPESIIYDTGFPIETKYAMASFISLRKDTAVVLVQHVATGPQLTASQESALAVALRTRLQMYPESEYFGTSTMRGVVFGRSGNLLNSQYRKPITYALELAEKSAKYMGAANGKWKSVANFDSSPNNIVTLFRDVNVDFTPETVRNKDWANGLVWPESFERRSLYFPAFQTVYDNDTSVLNSYFTMMACVELTKISERVRRRVSGSSSLTNAQFAQKVNEQTLEAVEGKFDNRYIIQSDCHFSKADEARGYSYTHVIRIGSPNMITVGIISIEAYRDEDLAAQQ